MIEHITTPSVVTAEGKKRYYILDTARLVSKLPALFIDLALLTLPFLDAVSLAVPARESRISEGAGRRALQALAPRVAHSVHYLIPA
jgi:hypothetical protein